MQGSSRRRGHRLSRAGPAAGRAAPSGGPGRSPRPQAPARSPCCRRSGGAVPSRGPSSPPLGPRVVPAGEISRVLGRRSAPRSGSNCGPGVRQPSSLRVRGRRSASGGDGRTDEPAGPERRPTRGPLRGAGRGLRPPAPLGAPRPPAPLPPEAPRLGSTRRTARWEARSTRAAAPTNPTARGAGAAGSCSPARAAIPREAPSPLDGASSGPPCGAAGLGPAWSAAVSAGRGAVALPCVSTAGCCGMGPCRAVRAGSCYGWEQSVVGLDGGGAAEVTALCPSGAVSRFPCAVVLLQLVLSATQ